MKKFKKIFLIVMDSVGVGNAIDAKKFDDEGANTFVNTSKFCNGLNIPTLNSLGIFDIDNNIEGAYQVNHPNSYVMRLNEISNGKDTLTGHWEMMGIKTKSPFKTFTKKGFPKRLINQLEKKTGHKFIANTLTNGVDVLKDFGQTHMETGSIIVYTTHDSVMQLAANEKIVPIEELYRVCKIARELCLKDKYKVARVIARPFLGSSTLNFKRTYRRHDFCVEPTSKTYLEILNKNNLSTICIGKIADIFSNKGVSQILKSKSNQDGMYQAFKILQTDFKGLCFVNLVEFDQDYGHRRNPLGYGKCLEEFDISLNYFINNMSEDDLLMITADHGNDPTFKGVDHTREQVPLILYSPYFKNGKKLDELDNFGHIGYSIITNFNLEKEDVELGNINILEELD